MIHYTCSIEQALIIAIADTKGIERYEVMAFFDETISAMSQCPPNLTRRQGAKKTDPDYNIPIPIWVLRGYYPGTGIFFKITLIHDNTSTYNNGMFAKVHHLNMHNLWKDRVHLDAEAVRRAVAEKELIGHDLPQMELKPQRLMTPKGMKPFRLYTRKKKR